MKNKIKNWLLTKLTKHLLVTVDESMVITESTPNEKGISYYLLNGQQIPVNQLKRLKQEALYMQETELWKIFQETIRNSAHKMIFLNSTNFDDVVAGKLMLHNLNIQKKIVDKFSKINLQS